MAKRSAPFRTVKTPPTQTFKTDPLTADGTFNPDDWKSRVDDPNAIASILNQYYGQKDPTGQGRTDDEYYDMLPQELQWLIEDQAEFSSLVDSYLKGDITYEELQEFELSDYGDAGTRFVEFYEEMQTLLLPTQESEEEEGSLEADPELMGTATVGETIGPEGFTTALLPTPPPADGKVEVDDIGGTELTGVDATAESTYTLPENEPVDVTQLPAEDQIAIWPQIQEALGGVTESVGKLLFGPKGIPTSIDEWLEWADETLQAQMEGPLVKAPLIITTTPDRGTWADVRIPVSFDADGTPIRIPLFDADGNFVGGEAIGESVRGQVLGPLEDVFIDKDDNITIDLPALGRTVLTDARINSDGNLTGTAATIGRVFFNTDTGEWEEGDGLSPETPTPATEEQDLPETQTRDTQVTEPPPPSSPPIVGEDEEETPPPTKGGKVGGRVITDKEGNVVEINRPDVIVGNGGVSVLPGTTTVNEPVDNRLDDDIWNRGPGVGTTLEPAEVGEELILEEPVVTTQDPVVTTQDPVVTTQDPAVTTEEPVVGGPVIVEQGPEDPLVGTDDPIVEDPLVGTLSGGGGGGGGGGLGSGGYMGGLSYGLPPFVGVQYQPKDYTAQLNRIINESLFKGMI